MTYSTLIIEKIVSHQLSLVFPFNNFMLPKNKNETFSKTFYSKNLLHVVHCIYLWPKILFHSTPQLSENFYMHVCNDRSIHNIIFISVTNYYPYPYTIKHFIPSSQKQTDKFFYANASRILLSILSILLYFTKLFSRQLSGNDSDDNLWFCLTC